MCGYKKAEHLFIHIISHWNSCKEEQPSPTGHSLHVSLTLPLFFKHPLLDLWLRCGLRLGLITQHVPPHQSDTHIPSHQFKSSHMWALAFYSAIWKFMKTGDLCGKPKSFTLVHSPSQINFSHSVLLKIFPLGHLGVLHMEHLFSWEIFSLLLAWHGLRKKRKNITPVLEISGGTEPFVWIAIKGGFTRLV